MSYIKKIALFLVLAVMVAGCGLAKRPAPEGEQPVPPAGGTPVESMVAAIFFADWQAQHLIPEQRQVPKAEGAALLNQIVKEILAGPTDPHLHRPFPADVKLVEPVTLQGDVAYVNLSKELANVRGAAAVTMALGSLRLSLTEVPGVNKVQVLIEGKKDVHLDEGVALEPMDRGFWGDYPNIPDPERAAYLQDRVSKGQDAWRTEVEQVLRWEGRMFGFTAAELTAGSVKTQGATAVGTIQRGAKAYDVQLKQEKNVWTIQSIGPAAKEAASSKGQSVALYFGDSQAMHVMPEIHQVAPTLEGSALATRLVELLIAGPRDPHLSRTLPQGLKLLEPVKVANGVATVNFSKEVQQVHGAAGEAMALNSLVLTLTDVAGITKVQVLVEGKKGAILEHIVLDQPLARGLYTGPVLVETERVKYLQAQGEPWRKDINQVLQWEGRLFGFTAAELLAAKATAQGDKGSAYVRHGNSAYTISLSRHGDIWVVDGIKENR